MADKTPMTRSGYNKMNDEHNRMRTIDLKECLQNLSDAREKGDISENAEYEVAKQALTDLQNRMNKIGILLANAHIIEGIIDDGTVQLLTWVKIKNINKDTITEYKIVPEHEISIKENKISPLSPIGKSLMGARVGDKISVDVPAGRIELEILDIKCTK